MLDSSSVHNITHQKTDTMSTTEETPQSANDSGLGSSVLTSPNPQGESPDLYSPKGQRKRRRCRFQERRASAYKKRLWSPGSSATQQARNASALNRASLQRPLHLLYREGQRVLNGDDDLDGQNDALADTENSPLKGAVRGNGFGDENTLGEGNSPRSKRKGGRRSHALKDIKNLCPVTKNTTPATKETVARQLDFAQRFYESKTVVVPRALWAPPDENMLSAEAPPVGQTPLETTPSIGDKPLSEPPPPPSDDETTPSKGDKPLSEPPPPPPSDDEAVPLDLTSTSTRRARSLDAETVPAPSAQEPPVAESAAQGEDSPPSGRLSRTARREAGSATKRDFSIERILAAESGRQAQAAQESVPFVAGSAPAAQPPHLAPIPAEQITSAYRALVQPSLLGHQFDHLAAFTATVAASLTRPDPSHAVATTRPTFVHRADNPYVCTYEQPLRCKRSAPTPNPGLPSCSSFDTPQPKRLKTPPNAAAHQGQAFYQGGSMPNNLARGFYPLPAGSPPNHSPQFSAFDLLPTNPQAQNPVFVFGQPAMTATINPSAYPALWPLAYMRGLSSLALAHSAAQGYQAGYTPFPGQGYPPQTAPSQTTQGTTRAGRGQGRSPQSTQLHTVQVHSPEVLGPHPNRHFVPIRPDDNDLRAPPAGPPAQSEAKKKRQRQPRRRKTPKEKRGAVKSQEKVETCQARPEAAASTGNLQSPVVDTTVKQEKADSATRHHEAAAVDKKEETPSTAASEAAAAGASAREEQGSPQLNVTDTDEGEPGTPEPRQQGGDVEGSSSEESDGDDSKKDNKGGEKKKKKSDPPVHMTPEGAIDNMRNLTYLIDIRREAKHRKSGEKKEFQPLKIDPTVVNTVMMHSETPGATIQIINNGFAIVDPFWVDPTNSIPKWWTVDADGKNKLCIHDGERVRSFSSTRGCHRYIRRSRGKYACIYCNRHMGDATDMSRHTRSHTGIRPYRCGVCGKGTTQLVTLESHMKSQHEMEPPAKGVRRAKSITCGMCDILFYDYDQYVTHLRLLHPGHVHLSKLNDGRIYKQLDQNPQGSPKAKRGRKKNTKPRDPKDDPKDPKPQ